MNLKKLGSGAILIGLIAGGAFAVPVLQLDISNGIYNPAKAIESTINTANQFDVIALLNDGNFINDNFFLSIAVTPKQENVSPAPDYGYFTIDGTRINVTSDMVYGNAPIDVFVAGLPADVQPKDNGDLSSHGIYDTYFTEVKFNFNAGSFIGAYDVQTGETASGSLYSKSFAVDLSGLNSNIGLHFDLYNEKAKSGDIDIKKFAPFSHDLDTKNVPEPSILSLFGLSLLGLGFIRRKKN